MARIFHKAGARKRLRSREWRGSEEAARMAIIIVSLDFFSALAAASERARDARETISSLYLGKHIVCALSVDVSHILDVQMRERHGQFPHGD